MTSGADTGGGDAAGGQARWLSAIPDAAAFAAGLGIAWYLGWRVRDLVWSLWLSSLLVGYSIIVWRIFGPALTDFFRPAEPGGPLGVRVALAGARVFGGLFLLAFFTFHFGMFHFIHSVFLNSFFPAVDGAKRGIPTTATYLHVLRQYWPFAIAAAVAERDAFRLRPGPQAGGGFMVAYTNVLRMHGLIFFFAFAHFAKLDNLPVYAFVYAVYFFPWRLLRRAAPAAPGASPSRAVWQ
jgi:hypothetical protein